MSCRQAGAERKETFRSLMTGNGRSLFNSVLLYLAAFCNLSLYVDFDFLRRGFRQQGGQCPEVGGYLLRAAADIIRRFQAGENFLLGKGESGIPPQQFRKRAGFALYTTVTPDSAAGATP